MCNAECIKGSVEKFLKGRTPMERDSSFDYCYNYFYSFYANDRLSKLASEENIQMSCFQLGFYLASWGMFRGRSKLLQKSVKCFEPLITWISKADRKLWEIDVDSYDDKAIQNKLIEAVDGIRKTFDFEPTNTLVTKIMLGVFGNIPALDTNFSRSFGLGMNKSNKNILKMLEKTYSFYTQNKKVIDDFEIYTLDFHGKETKTKYTKAKIIDMVGFVQGMKGQKIF